MREANHAAMPHNTAARGAATLKQARSARALAAAEHQNARADLLSHPGYAEDALLRSYRATQELKDLSGGKLTIAPDEFPREESVRAAVAGAAVVKASEEDMAHVRQAARDWASGAATTNVYGNQYRVHDPVRGLVKPDWDRPVRMIFGNPKRGASQRLLDEWAHAHLTTAEIEDAKKSYRSARQRMGLAAEFGDVPGHPFHGNQWVEGESEFPTPTYARDLNNDIDDQARTGVTWGRVVNDWGESTWDPEEHEDRQLETYLSVPDDLVRSEEHTSEL